MRRGLLASVLAWSGVAALHAIVPGFGVLFVLRLALGITEKDLASLDLEPAAKR